MRPWVTAGFAGTLFGVGLVVSGMTDPRNVVGFLDFFGQWNPSLAGVMAGAIAVHLTLLRLVPGGKAPVSPGARIDGALIAGAAIFGVGWGLGGYCPGPAIVSLGFRTLAPVAFVGTSVLGSLLADVLRFRSPGAVSAAGNAAADAG
jgi:uncharacterized protein